MLAISISRYAPADSPIEVNIYEGDPEVRSVGAGITVWPRTWNVMQHLGLREDLSRVTVKASGQALDTQKDGFSELHVSVSLPLMSYYPKGPAFVARKANQSAAGYTYARVDAPGKSP